MATTLDPLRIRRALGRHDFKPPREHGPDGWAFASPDGRSI